MSIGPITLFVNDHFGGDYTQAILALARQGGVAVAYLDREYFETWLERDDLSDREWNAIASELEDYDEWVSYGDTNADYNFHVLDKAGFVCKDGEDAPRWSLPDVATS